MNIRKWMISLFAIPLASTVLAMEPTLYPVDINGDGKAVQVGTNSGGTIFRTAGDNIIILKRDPVENSSDTLKYTLIKYNTKTKIALTSPSFISNSNHPGPSYEPVSESSDMVFFHYDGELNSTFESRGLHLYNFVNRTFTKVAGGGVDRVYAISNNGNYISYTFNDEDFIRDLKNNEVTPVPRSSRYSIGYNTSITNTGEIFHKYGTSESDAGHYVFSSKSKKWTNLEVYMPENEKINFLQKDIRVSPNGNFVSGYSEESDDFYLTLLDRENKNIYKYKLEGKRVGGFLYEHTVSDTGIASFFVAPSLDSKYPAVSYVYDFINENVLMESTYGLREEPFDLETKIFPALSADAQIALVAIKEKNSLNYHLYWTDFSSETEGKNMLKVLPDSLTIDPYENSTTTLKLNTEGSVFAADVSCNVVGPASITQAEYGAWGSENRFEIPMTVNDKAWQGALSQKAPALAVDTPSTFSNWTLLADITTADVNITCNVVASDSNGQMINMTVENATIRLDDKIHGGEATITGQIDIPGLTDLSGVEVIVTINGRTVKLLTDKDGKFSFEGLRDGEFTVSFKSPNHVQACQQTVIKEGSSVNLGKIELLAGDINNDGIIDILDFTYLAARYRSKIGEADYDVKADLNRDDIINIQDLAILGSHFGSTQCGKEL